MDELMVTGGRDPDGRRFDVLVSSGVVADGPPSTGHAVLDATGLVVAPGLVDLQVNGAAGVDVTAEPGRLPEVSAELARHGVTAYLPTVITSSAEARGAALEAWRRHPADVGARPLGVHLEGPMLAPERKGAHPGRWLAPPDLRLVEGWTPEAGVRVVTLAPELPGALGVVAELVSRGVVVSIGHTAASAEQVLAALDAGATAGTHLFNAMPPLSGRDPGPVGALLGDPRPVVGLIVDGHHLDPTAVRLAWRCLGPERFWAVSDTTAALGVPDGPARLGDHDVVVADGTVRLADGTLAGSAASLVRCLSVLLATTGCTLADALATATTVPARLLGDGTLGHLRPGARGDVALLRHHPDGTLEAVATVVGGRVVHDSRQEA